MRWEGFIMRKFAAFAPMLLVVLGWLVFLTDRAGGQTDTTPPTVQVLYDPTKAQPAVYRSAVGTDDTAAIDSTVVPVVLTAGYSKLRLSARCSISGTTFKLTCARGSSTGTWTVYGAETTSTVTAGASTVGGLYVAPDVVFDTGGAPACRVSISSISTGTVTLFKIRH